MTKMYKGLVAGLVLVSALIVPACRTTKKPTQAATATAPAPPDVPVTATIAAPVEPPRDFVVEEPAAPVTETLPADIEQLNIVAQQRGYLRDAFFGYDESTLTPSGQDALSSSATWLRGPQGSRYNLLIEGHTDERGTEQYNLALGDRRASIARDYLVTLGVNAGRIRTVSYGEERPFDPGHDETAWAKNRRAHLVLVAR